MVQFPMHAKGKSPQCVPLRRFTTYGKLPLPCETTVVWVLRRSPLLRLDDRGMTEAPDAHAAVTVVKASGLPPSNDATPDAVLTEPPPPPPEALMVSCPGVAVSSVTLVPAVSTRSLVDRRSSRQRSRHQLEHRSSRHLQRRPREATPTVDGARHVGAAVHGELSRRRGRPPFCRDSIGC